jgi:hypothetical protein
VVNVPTPASSVTAFASPADIKNRYDWRTLGDLCSDAGVKLTSNQLDSSSRLLECLNDASGMVEAAVTTGGQYTAADLNALTGMSQSLLKRLVCDLAMGMLWLARPDREGQTPKSFEVALEILESIRKGEKAFGLLEQQAASRLDTEVESERYVTGRHGIVVEAQRFFSRRNNRLHG